MALLLSTDVRLGCQGWSEADWTGPFYPTGTRASDRLESYATAFNFVEIDSSFYATPAPPTVLKWYDATPEDFRFSAKVPQAVTHDPDPKSGFPRKPLQGEGWQGHLENFAETMRLLEEKLAALLIQLPPQWHWKPENLPILERFVQALPPDLQWAIEFRHRGWLNDEVLDLLRSKGIALVAQDLYYMPRQIEVTTPDLAYIRLQGRRKEITRMDEVQIERDDALDFWAEAVRDLAERKLKRVVVASNNHYQGFAPGTIASLQARLGLPVATPPSRVA
ncbi:MAG TPA: DUF72 domain-containing protein [Chloroflexota bacterium]